MFLKSHEGMLPEGHRGRKGRFMVYGLWKEG